MGFSFTSLIDPITGLLDKFVVDKDKKLALAHEIATMAERHGQELAKAQLKVNEKEAEHKSIFVAGWRPAVAWVCVGGFTINFMISPLAAPFGIIIPQADTATMMPVLLGLLGLGTMRTYEKKIGKERNS
ncbi:MAG: hypothetical protein CME35_00315 [Gramella sp.]|nr:hypothetical protein [Christiangramia sp.]